MCHIILFKKGKGKEWSDVILVLTTAATYLLSSTYYWTPKLACRVDTCPSSIAQGNSYIRPCVLMKLKEISGLWAKRRVTVSQSIHTLRLIQVLAGYAYVRVSWCLSPLQIKLFFYLYNLQTAGCWDWQLCNNARIRSSDVWAWVKNKGSVDRNG